MYPVHAIFQHHDGRALGTKTAVRAALARLNVGPDRTDGIDLYGPGILVTLVPREGEVVSAVLIEESGVIEREIAQLSLERVEAHFPEWERSDEQHAAGTPEDTDEFFDVDEYMK